MSDLKELREQKRQLYHKAMDIVNRIDEEERYLTEEENQEVDELQKEISQLDDEIKLAEEKLVKNELVMAYQLSGMTSREIYEVLIKEVKFETLIAVMYELNRDLKTALGIKK